MIFLLKAMEGIEVIGLKEKIASKFSPIGRASTFIPLINESVVNCQAFSNITREKNTQRFADQIPPECFSTESRYESTIILVSEKSNL
jgi:hypothetical protein